MPDEASRDPDAPGAAVDLASLEIDIDEELIQEALAAVDRAAAQKREAASKRAEQGDAPAEGVEPDDDAASYPTPPTPSSLPPGLGLQAARTLADAAAQPDPLRSVSTGEAPARSERARLALRVRDLEAELRRSREELQRSTEICDGLDGQLRELRKAVRQAEQDAAAAFGRARRERDEVERLAEDRSIRSFLDIVDNVERALTHARSDSVDAAAVLAGLEMIAEQFRGALRRLDVERVHAEPGTTFDPTRHDALMHLPTSDHAPGAVVNEIAAGFLLRGRLVRPARVVVAAAPAPERE